MGRRYGENGDGWDSMCRAADKLSLINGFSPGHLISLALSLKSNLTLCMSVNINKPSTLHSNVIYCVAHGARQGSQFDGEDGSSVCLKRGQRGGEKQTNPALFPDIHQNRKGIEEPRFQGSLYTLVLQRGTIFHPSIFIIHLLFIPHFALTLNWKKHLATSDYLNK